MFFFQTCFARVFSNHHNSHNKHIKFKKFGGKIAQLLSLDLYKYKISRQIDSSTTINIHRHSGWHWCCAYKNVSLICIYNLQSIGIQWHFKNCFILCETFKLIILVLPDYWFCICESQKTKGHTVFMLYVVNKVINLVM